MSNKQFISNLSATYADVRKLDAKKINLKGKNILEYIKDATPTIKHSQDTRETITENDLWGQWVETLEDGTIIIHDDEVTNPNSSATDPDSSSAWNTSITKVENNKAYIGDELFANIQTEKIKNGFIMFLGCPDLTSFTSDLSSLTVGNNMFYGCPVLTSFTSDLSSLIAGCVMFSWCLNLTTFTSDLSSLTDGTGMFYYCPNLTSFTSDLSSLVVGHNMFTDCPRLEPFTADLRSLVIGYNMFANSANFKSFTTDLSSLVDGRSMFSSCSTLTSFSGDLSSLVSGDSMFFKTKLTPQSVMYIIESIRNIKEEKAKYPNSETGETGEIPWVTYDSTTSKYSAPFGFMENGDYVFTYKTMQQPSATTVLASNVGKLTLGINVSNNADTIQQQLEDFAKEATFDSWTDLKQLFIDKGWTVTFQYGATTTSIPYDLRNGEQIIPCPIFAKLVEAEKDSAEYCTEDASTFYNIDWGHDVTHYDDFQQFDSLEDAMVAYGVILKQTEEETV